MDEIKIEVFGRVQGVNFRSMTKSFCDDNKINGFVQNRADGSVLIVAQANREKLESLLKWIESSPAFSSVEKIEKEFREAVNLFDSFEIRRGGSFLSDKVKGVANLGKYLRDKLEIVPEHIVIIPDGNRRWAEKNGLGATEGHKKAAQLKNLKSLFMEAKNLGVKYISFWGFSTENWSRSKAEINVLMNLFVKVLEDLRIEASKERIRFKHIGRRDRLPKKVINAIEKLESETMDYNDFSVQLFLDYGGRDEIIRTVKKIISSGEKKIDEKTFEKFLDTSGIPDPDLIIRTSGEKRLSGMMPYQGVYAELYFSETMFPDFGPEELRKAVKEYSRRQRRFGG